MYESAKAHITDREERLDLEWEIGLIAKNIQVYLGHLARGYHEINRKQQIFDTLHDDPHTFVEISDWKMKWLMMLLRETQVDFFGKAGVCWHGTMYIMADVSGKDGQLSTWFIHVVSDDKKEDSHHTMSCIEAAQVCKA